ncbi:MAG: hypothetical protein ACOC3V_02385 [bacterium]
MDKDKLEEIIRKSVEDIWYNRRSMNPVEEQVKILTENIWYELTVEPKEKSEKKND